MNNHKIFRIYAFVSALLAISSLGTSCTDDIVLHTDDLGKYETVGHPYGFIKNAVSPSERLVDLYQTSVSRKVEVGITEAVHHAVDMKIAIDENVLTAYNKANNQNFEMLPASLVTIGQNGTVVIPPGYTKTEPVQITIAPSADLVEGKTYVVPLRISTDDTDVRLTDAQKQYLLYVVAQGKRLDAAKSAGYKVLSCMETNDTDPRIHCELFLSNEGKPLVDYVVLFSAGINYNTTTGKVDVSMNKSMKAILGNQERYLKPLKDMGIKVLLSLMGNHTPAGVSCMNEATSIQFVEELKKVIDAYALDGVFWDDEYSSANPTIPGFTYSDKANASRLIFETKRAMPDKLNTVFAYSTIYTLHEVDGVKSGEYVDYIIPNYRGGITISSWPGASTKQGMPYPYELNRGYSGYPSNIVSGNWGGIMVFALSEHRTNWNSYGLPSLRNIATTMFKDELYYTGKSYPVEW